MLPNRIELISDRRLNIATAIHIGLFVLVVTGLLSPIFVPFWLVLILVYIAAVPVQESILFFVRLIPFFIAVPLTDTFDSLNMWRVISIFIGLKFLGRTFRDGTNKIKQIILDIHPSYYSAAFWLLVLFLISLLSLVGAEYINIGLKRIIYFLNLSIIFIPIFYTSLENKRFVYKILSSMAVSVVLVTIASFIQITTVYFMDVYEFMRYWGEGVQCRQYGTQWCSIAVWVGNTWLAYNGPALILRVFSVFNDSHSYPTFVLMGIPAIIAVWKKKITLVVVTLALFGVILSGTRGVWVSWPPVVIWFIIIFAYLRKKSLNIQKDIFKRNLLFLIIFLILFVPAYGIFGSPQFKATGDRDRLSDRIRSTINLGETSNAARIDIWKKTLISIRENPILGVGIGNYAVVLSEDIGLRDAGLSAHNIYLHIASEMGIPALLIFLGVLLIIGYHAWRLLISDEIKDIMFGGSAILFLTWAFLYMMTDAILFDERVYLFFSVMAATLIASSLSLQPYETRKNT